MPRLNEGEWTPVAVVFDGKVSTLYVDDQEEVFKGKSVGVWVTADGTFRLEIEE